MSTETKTDGWQTDPRPVPPELEPGWDTPAFILGVRIMDSIDPALLEKVQARFNEQAMDAAQRVREQLDEGEDG